MKIIDAFWEKRNLGIESKEIILSNSDSLSDIESVLNSLLSARYYIVVKIPIRKPDFIRFLTEKGFYFVESLFEVSLHIPDFKLPESLKKFDEMLKYRKLTSREDLERLSIEIKKGIFTTDRIALDPIFGIDISSVRYINWLKDELLKGSEIFEISFKENPIAFFTLKNISEGKYDNFLAGMYHNESNIGFGFSILSKPLIELKNRQAKYYITHISSNNLAVMRLYFYFGFSPIDIVYVMTNVMEY
jgi:hypothetical protein